MSEAIFPDIRGGEIAIDSETEDLGLAKGIGAGWAWEGGGQVLGFSVFTPTFSEYYAFGHNEGNNCSKEKAVEFVTGLLDNPNIDPIFANAMYDLGWIRRSSGKHYRKMVHDVLIQGPLIDENKFSYSLDDLSLEYLMRRKDESELDAYAKSHGWKDVKSRMKEIPGNLVRKYAIMDADLTYSLHQEYKKYIIEEDLQRVYDLERRLVPLLIEMRWRGVPVDLDRTEQLVKKYTQIEKDTIAYVKRETGVEVELTNSGQIAKALQALDIPIPLTPKTKKPSIKNEWLQTLDHPVGKALVRGRKFEKAKGTFLFNGVLQHEIKGRIHASFNQLRSDRDEDGKSTGTVSGRFSSVEPNLQQIPGRDPEIGPEIRSCYLPEAGEQWGSLDYSSQEPRVMVHFSEAAERAGAYVTIRKQRRYITGAVDFANQYRADPRLDFHEKTRDAVRSIIPDFDRKPAKIIGLGLAYGMGSGKLAVSLGLPTELRTIYGKELLMAGPEAQSILDAFDAGVPFLKLMAKFCSERAKQYGYIKTPTGRRSRFPVQNGQRMFLHKAFNRLVQGTSACMMKTSMVSMYEMDNIVPLATVHDENDISWGEQRIVDLAVKHMVESFPLSVPIVVDVATGNNWGEAM